MRRVLIAVVAIAAQLLIAAPVAASPADPWYTDVDGHWACEAIRLLWEEEVTNGFDSSGSLYLPDQSSTRAELAVLLAKVFRLPPIGGGPYFPDVPTSYLICDRYPAYEWLQTAAKTGIVRGESDGLLHGNETITREQAIAMLMRGLELGPYMQRLTDEDINSTVAMFSDWQQMSDCFRRELATAARLLILQGYPDGTARPQGAVTRAEAATLIERACLVQGHSKPQVFSPDADGVADITILSITGLKNHNTVEWGISVFDSGFRPLRSWSSWVGWDSPQPSVMQRIWDGEDSKAEPCGQGLYFFRGYIRDRQGQYHNGAYKPIEIEKPGLWAWVYPSSMQPGDAADVVASVHGIPTRVHVVGWKTDMQPNANGWSSPLSVSSTTYEGRYYLTVRAVFASGASRSTIVSYDVLDPLELKAWLNPSILAVPGSVTIHAETSKSAQYVTARLPFPPYSLGFLRESTTTWRSATSVPATLQEGVYDIEVTGTTPTKSKTIVLKLQVVQLRREQYASVLLS